MKSDADRVRFGAARVAGLKQLEKLVREPHAQGDRLEAEQSLAQAQAENGESPDKEVNKR